MSTNLVRTPIAEGVSFSTIYDPKFKHNRLAVNFIVPLSVETASDYSILALLMRKGCKACPDFTKLNQTLDMLYGADLSTDVYKIGASQIISFAVTMVDDRYTINNDKLLLECAKLLKSVIFEPLIENGSFPEHDVEIERQFLIDTIESEINDKRAYAVNECRREMGGDDPACIRKFGTIEGAKRADGKSAARAHSVLINCARVEIMFTGSGDAKDAMDIFKDAFKPREKGVRAYIAPRIVERADNVKEKIERLDIVQSKLVMGFRTGERPALNSQAAMRMAVAIFGGTPSSKLFLNVREKLSLCYYCAARYDRISAIMMVDSGVEQDNITPAREEILRQLDDLKRGDFTDETMNNTRLQMINSLRGISDAAGALEDWYLHRLLVGEISTPEEEIDELLSVTREDIISAANKITLDTVYLLTSKEGGKSIEA